MLNSASVVEAAAFCAALLATTVPAMGAVTALLAMVSSKFFTFSLAASTAAVLFFASSTERPADCTPRARLCSVPPF